ncbi:integrase, catalytic region, zinc finger, CCHC-type containing protein [Tanacetum coccineum]|uniref:Integrase, catalytic region, zinc finger, CCHC-type containing protein n=1 Tax=Tanacetum coccineum TaxID=301880 RepID=A0ABQ5GK74_9ASTR
MCRLFTSRLGNILMLPRNIRGGKENGVNILKSIDEGPFQMGTFWETLAEGNEGALHLGPERARVYSDLSPDDKDRFTKLINDMRNIKMTMPRMQLNSKFVNNMLPEWGRFVTAVKLNRGLKESNYDQLYAYLKQHEAHANENKMMLEQFTQHTVDPLALMSNGRQNRGQGNNPRGVGAAGNGGVQNRVRNTNPGQARQIKCYKCNGIRHIARNCTQPKRPQDLDYFKDKRLLMQAQENGVVLDEEHLLFLAADECDAFDSDVDEAPTTQTMFMANLSLADPVYDEAGPSYDSDILSEYMKDNVEPVVQSNVSSVPNDAYMMIINEMHEQTTESVYANEQNKVVNASLIAELATYKEQVKLYERRAKFELTEREQKIEEQLRIVITDRNI